MDVRFQQIRGLPKLAWLADVDRKNSLVRLYHGSHVEVQGQFFIEGVWNGSFPTGNFARTDCIFGTGGVIQEKSIVFVSSASTTDYLYYQNKNGRVVVSNSLPFLLSRIDDLLDPNFLRYHQINESIIEGINAYIREIPTIQGMIRRVMYRNLHVSAEGVDEVEKDMPPRFEKYEDYYGYIVDNYELISKNIRDSARKRKMEIFSTQSRGYDTTAVNAIGARYGIDKVFTVTKGKGVGYFVENDARVQVNDDGTDICKALGLKCVAIDRRAFERGFEHEYLYFAAIDGSQDANLMEINGFVSGVSVLLTGF